MSTRQEDGDMTVDLVLSSIMDTGYSSPDLESENELTLYEKQKDIGGSVTIIEDDDIDLKVEVIGDTFIENMEENESLNERSYKSAQINNEFPILQIDSTWIIKFEDVKLKGEIGHGSFGKVYYAEYLGTPVAVKQLIGAETVSNPNSRKYIDREIKVLCEARHPNIVQFLGVLQQDQILYIVTEYIPNGNIRELLRQNPNLGWKTKILMASDVARSMVYLHAKSIIHRDLKSKNLLVDEKLRIKVCDFGLAKVQLPEDEYNNFTICGTNDWMAPEVITGSPYNEKADIFSFGMVLIELILIKKSIFRKLKRSAGNLYALDPEQLRTLVTDSCPPELLVLVLDCTEVDQNKRPEFKDILQRLLDINAKLPNDPQTEQPQIIKSPILLSSDISFQSISKKEKAKLPTQQHPLNTTVDADNMKRSPSQNFRQIMKDLKEEKTTIGQIHIDKLVERLTSEKFPDLAFVKDFLLTYRVFCLPQVLLSKLCARLNRADDCGQESSCLIQLRVVNVLKLWIDRYEEDYETDPALKQQLIDFVQSTANNTNMGIEFKKQLQNLLKNKKNYQESLPYLKIPKSILPPKGEFTFLDVHPVELARQLTLSGFELFKAVKPRMLIEQKKWRDSEAVKMALQGFGLIRTWVGYIYLSQPQQKQRLYLKRLIELSETCLALNNYNVLFAILTGLRVVPINVIKSLPSQHLQTFYKLLKLTSKDDDFQVYRDLLSASQPPCIPFLGMFLYDLATLDMQSEDVTADNLINFAKLRQKARIIFEFENLLKTPYSLSRIQAIQDFLMSEFQKIKDLNSDDVVLNILSNANYEQMEKAHDKKIALHVESVNTGEKLNPNMKRVDSPRRKSHWRKGSIDSWKRTLSGRLRSLSDQFK